MNLPCAFVSSTIEGPRLPKSHLKVTKSYFSCQSLFIEPQDKRHTNSDSCLFFWYLCTFGICAHFNPNIPVWVKMLHFFFKYNEMCQTRNQRFEPLVDPEACRLLILIMLLTLCLQITCVINQSVCAVFWMLKSKFTCQGHECVYDISETTPLGSSEQHLHKRDERCKQIKGRGGALKQQQQRLTWMKLTNKGDIDCRVQLLPSFPPSLLFDPVDVKAGFSTKEPVWRGRNHHVGVFLFVFGVLLGEPPDVVFQETFYVKMFHKILMVNFMYGAVGQTTMEHRNIEIQLLFMKMQI